MALVERAFIEQQTPSFETLFPRSPEIRFPTLQHINTRVFVTEMRRKKNNPNLRLADISAEEWKEYLGDCDAVWLMGIYQVSQMARLSALQYAEDQYRPHLPDMTVDDVTGSCFAIPTYEPDSDFVAQDWKVWDEQVRDKLHSLGKKVITDLTINNTGLDKVADHPELYVTASPERAAQASSLDFNRDVEIKSTDGESLQVAHGNCHNYPAWTDTAQLDLSKPETHNWLVPQPVALSQHCDGLRCDMAMLAVPWQFQSNWGWLFEEGHFDWMNQSEPLWKKIIDTVHSKKPDFSFIAEVYNDGDKWELLRNGFTYVYEKYLYDIMPSFLSGNKASEILAYFGYFFQNTHEDRVVFFSNHDEATLRLVLGPEKENAALVLFALLHHTAWLVDYNERQGRTNRLPMQVCRQPDQEPDPKSMRLHQNLEAIRSSDLFQNGEHDFFIPEQCSADNDSNKSIVAHHISRNTTGVFICTNTAGWDASCAVTIPENSTSVHIYDLTDGVWYPHEVADSNVPIVLKPYHSQIVYYSV